MQIDFEPTKLKEARVYVDRLQITPLKKERALSKQGEKSSFFKKIFNLIFKKS